MKRTPEPELMTEEEQARAYADADFEVPHNHFVDLMLGAHPSLSDDNAGQRACALDLGCGPADVTLRVARRLPKWTFVGLDGSDAMLAHGARLIATADASNDAGAFASRISLRKTYLPADDVTGGPFGLIFSNSLLHHLADAAVLWNAIKQFGEPNVPVFVMDLMRPESAERATEMVDEYAADEPEVLKHDFLHSLHAAYTLDEVNAQLRAANLDTLEAEAVSDRHLIVSGLL